MKKFVILSCLALAFAPSYAGSRAPAKLQAALIIKLLPYYNNLGNKEFTIHVVSAPDVAELLQQRVGQNAGKAKLVSVTASDSMPSGQVDVLYVGENANTGTAFSKEKGVLSITGNPDLIEAGVTLGIGLEDSKPKVYLNLASSKAEGVDWNPAILKVAKKVG